MKSKSDIISKFKAHPWHGISIGTEAPKKLNTYIEIVPSDTVKFEIDKESGFRKVDRPQKYSNIVPALYGFIPQTYCGDSVADFAMKKTGRKNMQGDKDPLDILVLTEKNINYGDIIVEAIPIGGFRMIDKGEVDDKIISVMAQDEFYSLFKDLSEIPENIIKRLKHYFLTYKNMPGTEKNTCEITHVYGKKEAQEVIRKSIDDYQKKFNR